MLFFYFAALMIVDLIERNIRKNMLIIKDLGESLLQYGKTPYNHG